MTLTLDVTPPVLMQLLTREEIQYAVVLFDLEPDVLPSSNVRLDLNVLLNSIPIPSKFLSSRADFYFGCTGVEIDVATTGGIIESYTPDEVMPTNYQNTVSRKRTSNINIAPKVTYKTGQSEGSVEGGEIALSAEQDSTYSVSFSSSERTLISQNYHQGVKWTLAMPRGAKAISDCLSGNLYLYAECRWQSLPARGEIKVRPTAVGFFDPERRRIGTMRSLVMEFMLWRQGIKPTKADGVAAKFTLIDKG